MWGSGWWRGRTHCTLCWPLSTQFKIATFVCAVQEGNLHNPRACATAFPCVVKQGLLFVKPQPLPKTPVTAATNSSSRNGASSRSHSHAASSSSVVAAADPYADVPTIPELDEEGWVSQVSAAADVRHPACKTKVPAHSAAYCVHMLVGTVQPCRDCLGRQQGCRVVFSFAVCSGHCC